MKTARSQRIKRLLMDLVRIQSDTGTRLEKDVETYLYGWLGERKYFKDHPDYFGQYRLPGDLHGRSIVWGLVKGRGDHTVILMHHHDVVDAFDYGNLRQWAYDPQQLQKAMTAVALADDVHQDLTSGEWIFGRGTADMKAGAALQLVLLEDFSNQEKPSGNVLLLSLPDEESLSEGMRGGLNLLMELQEKFDLAYRMLIGSEPQFRDADGLGIFYEGSAGKLLPVIYVRGRKTHIGEIYQGFNPLLLLSDIVLHTELNPDFQDEVRGETTPPPCWSYLRDRKESYDASTPLSAGGYLSLISLKTSPKELLARLKKTCETAFDHTLASMNERYRIYRRKTAKKELTLPWEVNVKTFVELYQMAVNDSGQAFLTDYNRTMDKIVCDIQQNAINAPEATFLIIEKTLSYVSDLFPIVIIAFSPPYYPPINNADFNALPDKVRTLTDELIRFAGEKWSDVYKKVGYLMGITDMSYAALQNGPNIVPYVGPNMPLWEKAYYVPFAAMEALSIPVVNIGPWGKDCHKFTERVYKRDLLERTPEILEYAVRYLLKN